MPKGCDFIAPVALIQQFIFALFTHFLSPVHERSSMKHFAAWCQSSSYRKTRLKQVNFYNQKNCVIMNEQNYTFSNNIFDNKIFSIFIFKVKLQQRTMFYTDIFAKK